MLDFQNLPIDIYNYIAEFLSYRDLIRLTIAWPKLRYFIVPYFYNFKKLLTNKLTKYINNKEIVKQFLKMTSECELSGELIIDLFSPNSSSLSSRFLKSSSYNLVVYKNTFYNKNSSIKLNDIIEFMHNNFKYMGGGCGITYFNVKNTNLIIHVQYYNVERVSKKIKNVIYKNNKLQII